MLPTTMIAYGLLVLVCLKAVSGCTSGFMQLDLVKKRAEKITSGNVVSGNKLDHELRVVPGLNFNCSGNITSLMVGADIRAIGGNRDEYPEIQIWRGAQMFIFGFIYQRQSRTNIALTEGNSSPNGVIQYNMTTPISFQSGDFLGVYQPPENDSVVRLFYIDDPSAPVANFRNNSNAPFNLITPISNPSTISNHHVLILPITDPPGCTSASFHTPEELRQNTLEVNINSVVVRDQQQRVFPDITFTCNGSITKWIVGAGTGGGSSPPSELQIWRRSGSDYTKVGSTQLTAQSPTSDPNVYEYIPSPPLGFQEGDILGVYQRNDSNIVPYYQESTGPENLRQSALVSSAPNSLTAPVVAAEYDYPLLTVETGPPLTTSISSLSSVQLVTSNPSGPPLTTSILPSSSVQLVTSNPSDPALTTSILPSSSVQLVTSNPSGPPLTTSILPSSSVQLVTSNPSDSIHPSLVHSSDVLPTSSANEGFTLTPQLNNSMTSTSSATVESSTATIISVISLPPMLTKSSELLTSTSISAFITMSVPPLAISADAVTITIISSGAFLVGISALIIVIVLATLIVYKRKKGKVEISDRQYDYVTPTTSPRYNSSEPTSNKEKNIQPSSSRVDEVELQQNVCYISAAECDKQQANEYLEVLCDTNKPRQCDDQTLDYDYVRV